MGQSVIILLNRFTSGKTGILPYYKPFNFLSMLKNLLLLILFAGISMSLASAINANTLGHINQNKGYPGAEKNITPMKWVDGPGEGEIVQQ